MRVFSLVGVLSLALVSCGENVRSDVRVVGGDGVSPVEGARLGLVGLVAHRDGVRRGYCTGTLVASNAILTAIHCRNTPRGPVRHAVFAADIFASEAHAVAIERVEPIGVADLGIAWLSERAPSNFRPAVLVGRLNGMASESVSLAAFGFGRRSTAEPSSGGVLQKLSILPANLMPGSPIFLARSFRGRGLCYGDSGGPVFLDTTQPQVVGVLSNGTPECEAGGDTYVAIPFYISALEEALRRGGATDFAVRR